MSKTRNGKTGNTTRILQWIAQEGEIARIDIAAALGLSAATVTSLTAGLMARGILENVTEEPNANAPRGRPRELLRLNPKAYTLAGAKIANDHITVALMDFNGGLIAEHRFEDYAFSSAISDLAQALKSAVTEAAAKLSLPLSDIAALGVGVPGFVDSAKGIVHWSPAFDSTPVDLASMLQAEFPCPVLIDNDANMAALAEKRFGLGVGASDFLVVTIEHGVGMGLVLNNKLFQGSRGLGPEFGHTKVVMNGALCRCGQRGCLEAYVADYALSREAQSVPSLKREAGVSDLTHIDAICQAADAGDQAAANILDRAGRVLGTGLANLCNLFDPSLIIFSGDRMQLGDHYSKAVKEELTRNALLTDRPFPLIKHHKWGDLLWAKGACALASEHILSQSARDATNAA